MAPRSTTVIKSGGTRATESRRPAANGNGRAGPSRPAASSSTSTKKRPVQKVEDEEDEDDDDFVPSGGQLDLIDDEAEESEEEAEGEEGSVDEEAFPELDSGSEADLDDDEQDALDRLDDDESDDEDLLVDEETGSESGYNSSDIDAMDQDDVDDASSSTSLSPSASSSKADLTTDEKLSKLIAKNSIKPSEEIGTDARISSAKQGHGRLRPSKLVEGGYKREYEDVEAGYGSESSTEDVSVHCRERCDFVIGLMCDDRTPTRSAMSLLSGMTTFRISVTM